jgi:predicted RNase H-like HicB family nuclease
MWGTSASGVFSTSERRFIISVVIGGSQVAGWSTQPDPNPEIAGDRRKPSYTTTWGTTTVIPGDREERMYRVWYWAMIDRESDGRFIASIPDLGDLAAYGNTDKDAVAYVTERAAERVRAAIDDGQPVPPRRQCSEMPSQIRSKEVGRAIIPVEVGRREAWPTPPYHMSA